MSRIRMPLRAIVPASLPEVAELPLPARGIGDNGGPPFFVQPVKGWTHYCWIRAARRAWRPPPREVAMLQLRRSQELGVSWREYAAAMMDTGRPPPSRKPRR